MHYTNDQLQLVLAKMLPNELVYSTWTPFGGTEKSGELRWRSTLGGVRGNPVSERELLYICSLLESKLFRESYSDKLKSVIQDDNDWVSGAVQAKHQTCRATWQQRTIAIAQMKKVQFVALLHNCKVEII